MLLLLTLIERKFYRKHTPFALFTFKIYRSANIFQMHFNNIQSNAGTLYQEHIIRPIIPLEHMFLPLFRNPDSLIDNMEYNFAFIHFHFHPYLRILWGVLYGIVQKICQDHGDDPLLLMDHHLVYIIGILYFLPDLKEHIVIIDYLVYHLTE